MLLLIGERLRLSNRLHPSLIGRTAGRAGLGQLLRWKRSWGRVPRAPARANAASLADVE
jgi:hypothetical protein